MNYDVGTWRATLSPFVILTTEGRKDLGSIAQPEVDVTEILHSVQDDKMVESSWRATFLFFVDVFYFNAETQRHRVLLFEVYRVHRGFFQSQQHSLKYNSLHLRASAFN